MFESILERALRFRVYTFCVLFYYQIMFFHLSVVQLSPMITQNHLWRRRDKEMLCWVDLCSFFVHVATSIEMMRSRAGEICARSPL